MEKQEKSYPEGFINENFDELSICKNLLTALRYRNKEIEQYSFICQIMYKKLEGFNFKIKIPFQLLTILEVCTHSNPGQSQALLLNILYDLRGRNDIKEGYIIKPEDFVYTYGDRFPFMNIQEENDLAYETWNNQKINKSDFEKYNITNNYYADNKVDYRIFWEDLESEIIKDE